MEGDPSGAPGADDAPQTIEVVRGAMAGDIQVISRADEPSGAPDDDAADPSPDGADADPTSDADAEATAAAEADRADLEQYPESVRDYLKAIPQEHRKTLHEHFGQREREQMRAEQERADAAEAANRETEARAQQLRATQGKFVGETPIDLLDANGATIPGPTYDQLAELLSTRRGRDELATRYGLDEGDAEAAKAELDQRRAMLTASAGHFDRLAWGTLAQHLKTGLTAVNGVDADAVIAEAARVASEGGNGPATVLALVARSLDERHERELTALKNDFQGRIDAGNANAEGLRGRVVAAESRRLPTGGRTGGGSAESEVQRLARENPEEYRERAMRGEFAGLDLTK